MTTNVESKAPAATAPRAAAPKPGRMGWIVFLFLVAGVGVGGAAWWSKHQGPSAHAAPAPHESSAETGETGALAVEAILPQPGGIVRTSTQTGSVDAFEDADLYAKISGYLKILNVDIGDRVREGQELAVIDDPEVVKDEELAAATLEQRKAVVKQSEAALAEAKASAIAFEKKVDEAKAEIERYSATRRYREKELARYVDLLKRQSIPQSIVDEQQDHLESAIASQSAAKAGVETAEAEALEAKAKVSKAEADVMEAKAQVQVAEANLGRAKVLVGYTSIKSPYTGVVTARLVHRGDFIRSAAEGNQKPLLTVARTDMMRIVTYVPDRDVAYVDIGDKAEVNLDALSDVIKGEVTRFADSEDPDSRTMRTEIIVPNPTGRIREGMFGLATILLEQTNASLTIPDGCLIGGSKGSAAKVFVIRDGKAKEVPITTGVDNGIRVEVVAGLTEKDQVIVSHTAVIDGVPVTVIKESKKTAPSTH